MATKIDICDECAKLYADGYALKRIGSSDYKTCAACGHRRQLVRYEVTHKEAKSNAG